MLFRQGIVLTALLLASSCGPKVEPKVEQEPPPPDGLDNDPGGGEATPPAGVNNDAPEISRSVGPTGGVLVFWPRIIPRSDDPEIKKLAAAVQAELAAIAKKTAPDAKHDVRPEPERVCTRAGCAAATLGAVLLHKDGGCTVVGLVAKPGTSPQRLVPWAGAVALKQAEVPFRDPPESQVTIKDAVPCTDLAASLAANGGELGKALGEVAK